MGQLLVKQPRRYPFLRTVGAFAAGATIGSIGALLFAPASGRVTRRRIAMKMRTLQKTASRKIGQTGKLILAKAGDVREVTSEKLQDARKWLVEHVNNGNGRHSRRRAVHHA